MLTSKITRLVGSSGSLVRSKAARPAGSAGAVAHAPSSARAAARVASAALLVLCLRRIGPHTTILPTDNTVPTTPLTRAPRSGRFRALPLVQSARFFCPQPILRPPACRREDTAPMTALPDAAALLPAARAGLGAAYLAAVWYAVGRFAPPRPGRPRSRPPVTP